MAIDPALISVKTTFNQRGILSTIYYQKKPIFKAYISESCQSLIECPQKPENIKLYDPVIREVVELVLQKQQEAEKKRQALKASVSEIII